MNESEKDSLKEIEENTTSIRRWVTFFGILLIIDISASVVTTLLSY